MITFENPSAMHHCEKKNSRKHIRNNEEDKNMESFVMIEPIAKHVHVFDLKRYKILDMPLI